MPDVLHFRGDCTRFDPDQLFGPDRFGAYYAPVEASYDAERDWTTLVLRPLAPVELQDRYALQVAREQIKQRIRELFSGGASGG